MTAKEKTIIRKKKSSSDFLKSIEIGGIEYNVIEFDKMENNKIGYFCQIETQIGIYKKLKFDQKIKTLMYESLRGVIAEYGILMPDEIENVLVPQLTTGVCEVMAQIIDFCRSEENEN